MELLTLYLLLGKIVVLKLDHMITDEEFVSLTRIIKESIDEISI